MAYLHYQIRRNNLELKITLPIVVWRKIRIHLPQLDVLGISNQNHFFEEIYLQPVGEIREIWNENWVFFLSLEGVSGGRVRTGIFRTEVGFCSSREKAICRKMKKGEILQENSLLKSYLVDVTYLRTKCKTNATIIFTPSHCIFIWIGP